MIYFITVSLIIFILTFFFEFEVYGKENLPSKGAYIIASNHVSYFDPPIIAAGCYFRKLNFLAKKELFRHRLFGWYIRTLGAYPIKRKRGDISAIKESIKRLKIGNPLVVFPEGGRSKDGKLQEGLPGIAFLATKENIPIVPAFIKGAEKVLSPESKKVNLHKIRVRFGEPFFLSKKDYGSYNEMSEKIMQSIEETSHFFDKS